MSLPRHIHITGASGSGTTTLGAVLAARLGYGHFDTDDFYWETTEPPFQRSHPVELRRRNLREALDTCPGWILSGSLAGWGDIFIPLFDTVIFLSLAHDVRMERLRAREASRYGAEELASGGRLNSAYTGFMAWAARYDSTGLEQRSRALHEKWLENLPMPVVRLDGLHSTERQVDILLEQFGISGLSRSPQTA